jgi:hypothetical protein
MKPSTSFFLLLIHITAPDRFLRFFIWDRAVKDVVALLELVDNSQAISKERVIPGASPLEFSMQINLRDSA